MSLTSIGLYTAMGFCLIPVVAAWLRHRSGIVPMAVTVAAVFLGLWLALLRLTVSIELVSASVPWFFWLTLFSIPTIWAGYLLSCVLGREDPRAALRGYLSTFLLLIGVGSLFFLSLKWPTKLLAGYGWEEGFVVLGTMGKLYLGYLLVGLIFIGYNLENTFRLARAPARKNLRIAIIGLFGLMGFLIFMITTGLLYGAIRVVPLAAVSIPVVLGCVLGAYGISRGALTDVSVPVSRGVVYSSFTAFVAAVYLVAVGVMAQLATYTQWSPGQVVTIGVALITGLIAVALFFSQRLQRSLRRFIDRNFYVNRYDYRSQWSKLTKSLDPALSEDQLLTYATECLKDVFQATDITISLLNPTANVFYPCSGKGTGTDITLPRESPLATKLVADRQAILLDNQPDDFEYIAIYVEDEPWLEATASDMFVALPGAVDPVGILGMTRKDDPFSFEDADLLESMAIQIAAILRGLQLSRDLSNAREMEVVAQWSNMVLHDLKNHISPLRMMVDNITKHGDKPEFQESLRTDLSAVVDSLESLIQRLHQIREGTEAGGDQQAVSLHQVLRSSISRLYIERMEGIEVREKLAADDFAAGNPVLLRRVVENLLTNALEAMGGEGVLSIETHGPSEEDGFVEFSVQDTGSGMDAVFVNEKLFTPFASTKANGLGLGLYQTKSIVRAHGGELRVSSELGEGTTMLVRLPGVLKDAPGFAGRVTESVS